MADEWLVAKVEELDEHVTGQAHASPGLLMRMDRVETISKVLLALAGIGSFWKLVEEIMSVVHRKP